METLKNQFPYLFTMVLLVMSFNVAGQKLPGDSLHAIHYDIHLQEINLTNQTISGYTTLTLTPKVNNVTILPIELLTLTVDSILVNGQPNPYQYNDTTLIRVLLATPLNISDTAEVSVYYHGHPFTDASNWGGFHYSGSYAFNLGVGFSSNPHNLGKAWFPCIDNFTDRALYDMYITVPELNTAVCGGTLMQIIENGNETHTFHWKMHNTIPTYLASVAVGNYVAVRDTFDGINMQVPIAIYVRPVDTARVPGSFVNLKNILAVYENRFGPYPWERVGYVGASLGAMEHATNITYPNSSITGNTDNEWLYAHELSHMWFGDKVTCASAEEMWLNEGWAVFCESVFREGLYDEQSYKDNMRSKLKEVLQFTHHTDNGYLALYGIPPEYTYGSTVYDKGGQVTHTLRGYLGDSLFFDMAKGYLNEFAYHHASTTDLRDYITAHTGINMTDFFNAWVYTPGFPHFSIDSFQVVPFGNLHNVTVYTRQKHKGTDNYANANRVEITFMNNQWQSLSDTMIFSGRTGSKTFTIPFSPDFVMMDANDRLSDAVTAYTEVIKTTGLKDYPDVFFKIDVKSIADSAFLRIEHNWVAPDSLKTPLNGLTLSDYRYWKIDGIFPDGFNATGWFFYNKNAYLDNNLITNANDSLVILYRPSPAYDWQPVNFIKNGPWGIGNILVDNLQKGEYTLAVWDENVLGLQKQNEKQNGSFRIFPNPAREEVNFEYVLNRPSNVEVYTSMGKLVDTVSLNPTKHHYCWKHRNLPAGTYLLKLTSGTDKTIIVQKLVIE